MVQTYSVVKVHQIIATIAPKPKFKERSYKHIGTFCDLSRKS